MPGQPPEVACGVARGILLADDARNRVDLAGLFSRGRSSRNSTLHRAEPVFDEARMSKCATKVTLMKTIPGPRSPTRNAEPDKRGRVVARVHSTNDFGDVVAGCR
jgi:hypothetical protein